MHGAQSEIFTPYFCTQTLALEPCPGPQFNSGLLFCFLPVVLWGSADTENTEKPLLVHEEEPLARHRVHRVWVFPPPQPCFYCPLLTTLQWLPITVLHMDWWFQSNLLGLALQRYQVDHCWSRVMAHRSVFSSCSLFGISLKVLHNKRLEGEKKKIDSTTQAIWLLSVPRTYSSLSFPVSGMFSI